MKVKKLKKLELESIQATIYMVGEKAYCVGCHLPLKSDRSLAKLTKYFWNNSGSVEEMGAKLANDIFNIFGSFDILLEKDTLHITARCETFCQCELSTSRTEFWQEYLQELENNSHCIAKYKRIFFEKTILVKRENLRKELIKVQNSSEKDIQILGVRKMEGRHHKMLAEMRKKFRLNKIASIKSIKAELRQLDAIVTSSQKFF
jgi:hypothetical protein